MLTVLTKTSFIYSSVNNINSWVVQLVKQNRARHIYVYNSSHLTPTERVKFFYALKGRNGKPGILDSTQSIFLAKAVISTPKESVTEIEAFLNTWKCKFSTKKTSNEKPTHALIRYSTTQLNASQRVQFVYGMYGRGKSKGIFEKGSKEVLAKSIFFVPLKRLIEVKQFLKSWNCEILIEEVKVNE